MGALTAAADATRNLGAAVSGKGGPKGKGSRRDRYDRAGRDNGAPKPKRPRPEEKPLDPLSPFAILQQLKDK